MLDINTYIRQINNNKHPF